MTKKTTFQFMRIAQFFSLHFQSWWKERICSEDSPETKLFLPLTYMSSNPEPFHKWFGFFWQNLFKQCKNNWNFLWRGQSLFYIRPLGIQPFGYSIRHYVLIPWIRSKSKPSSSPCGYPVRVESEPAILVLKKLIPEIPSCVRYPVGDVCCWIQVT